MTDPSILYFEDDALSREVMHACLTRGLGYQNVTIFEDSSDFDSILERLPFDGFAMLELIRQDKVCQSTKVIALTASVMNEEVKILKEAGFDGVIAKPLDYDIFPNMLRRILDGEQVWHIR
jgi:CheY-like chemotaxis protein